jgi:hypothetical protein
MGRGVSRLAGLLREKSGMGGAGHVAGRDDDFRIQPIIEGTIRIK